MRYIWEHLICLKKYTEKQRLLKDSLLNGKKYGALGLFDVYCWAMNVDPIQQYRSDDENMDFYE